MSISNFTILSFNLQCSLNGTQHEQLFQLVEIVKSNLFECVSLQDVNLTSLSILKSKLHKYSAIEAIENGTQQVILYKDNCKLEEEYSYNIPSNEGHEILGCKLVFKEKEYEILNIWLEKNQKDIREKQVDVLLEISSDNTIMVGDFNIFEINEPANSLILQNNLCDAWINSGCNSQLRDTTFNDGTWYRTVRLLYFKKMYSVICNGLMNNSNDNSMVFYSVKALQ